MLCPYLEEMDFPATRRMFISFARRAAGWHAAELDTDLLSRHGTSYPALSGNPMMNRWLSWLLNPCEADDVLNWFHGLVLDAIQTQGLDASLLKRESTMAGWRTAIRELSSLKPVLLHADMHDGQLVLDKQCGEISGVIDWDNFCVGNPLVDFNTSKWFPDRMWLYRHNFQGMRTEMWREYLGRRGISGMWDGGLNLFCLMTEMVRVIVEQGRPRIWMTKGPYREALIEYLQHLEKASCPDA